MISVFDKLISLISSKVPMKNSTDNNVNCDDYYETGIYYLGSGLTNAPAAYIKLIVAAANKGQKGDVAQIAIAVSSGSVYIRTGNFSSSDQVIWWHNWITIYQNIVTGTPFETGRTIDGKIEYGKRINFGSLPNATSKSVALGITNFELTDMKIKISDGYTQIMLPFVTTTASSTISSKIDGNNLTITTYSDRSQFTAVATVYYLKS